MYSKFLQQVSLTLAENFAIGINTTRGTGGKFAAGVIDTGGAPRLLNISANKKKI
jgi:hypothetical protein